MSEEAALTRPYPGLRPFEADETHFFFGRDEHSDALLRRLRQSRFLAVVGTSGSGKSSLVRAGLLPSLYGGFMVGAGSGWRIATLRPGTDPVGALAAALNAPEVFGSGEGEGDAIAAGRFTETTLRRGPLGLVEAAGHGDLEDDENLLVLVDQFEEIFRFAGAGAGVREDDAGAFVQLLLEAAGQRQLPIYVLLTMRSDFLGDCARFRGLPEALNDGQYLAPRLTREQLREAIVGPAAVGGAEIAPRLVQRLLGEVGDDPDQLPILQHALMRTWDVWEAGDGERGPLDLDHYLATGGMAEALSRHADETWNELPSPRHRKIARELFQRLTEKGGDHREVRRPTRLAEICRVAEASEEEVGEVIEVFRRPGRSFLMPPAGVALTPETTLDISHESLMRIWSRLRGWVEKEAESAARYRRLAQSAALHAAGKAPLLQDPELALTLGWRDDQRPNAAWAERYDPAFAPAIRFLEASREAREVEARENERLRRIELGRKRDRAFVAILALAFLAALALGVYGFWQQRNAERQRRRAEAGRLGTVALLRMSDQPALGMLLSVEAWRAAESFEAQRSLLAAAQSNPRLLTYLRGHRGPVSEVAWSPDGNVLASAGCGGLDENGRCAEGAIRLWDVARRQPLDPPLTLPGGAVLRLAWSPDGSLLASGNQSGLVQLWTVASRELRGELEISHRLPLTSLAWSPDGKRLAAGRWAAALDVWDVASDPPVWRFLQVPARSVHSVAFRADGRVLAAGICQDFDRQGCTQGGVRLWDAATGDPIGEYPAELPRAVLSVAFSPEGRLAIGDEGGDLRVWAPPDLLGKERLLGTRGEARSLAFSPDGATLATAGGNGTVILWDVAGWGTDPERPPRRPLGDLLVQHEDPVLTALSPDGKVLAEGGGDTPEPVQLWDLASRQRRGPPLTETGAYLEFLPQGATLAVSDEEGMVRFWDVASREPVGEPMATQGPGFSISPDGELLASFDFGDEWKSQLFKLATRKPLEVTLPGLVWFSPRNEILAVVSEKALRLWDLKSGKPLGEPLSDAGWPAFSPDGSTLAAYGENGIVFWDTASRKPVGEPLTGPQPPISFKALAFSPDGATLAVGDDETRLWLFDMSTRLSLGESLSEEVTAGLGFDFENGMGSLAFTPDGRTLVSSDGEGGVWIWDVDRESWAARACRRANRNLSLSEWRQYLGAEVPYRRTCPELPAGDGAT